MERNDISSKPRTTRRKCTCCRVEKVIVFEHTYSLVEQSALVSEPVAIRIALCTSCAINFIRTQMMEIGPNQIKQLAGKGRPLHE